MQHLKIDGELFKQLVINGAANLSVNYKAVDALNVFPVPDGDTGTNMRMTIEAGANEIRNLETKSIYEISKVLSRGMLMGARGNSGVILSQFFRGIYKGFKGTTEKGLVEVTTKELGKAFLSGVDQAYHAVMKPVEGTILTVARESSKKAYKLTKKTTTIEEFFRILIDEAHASLGRTPSLLPVLQEAGVVDSGGAGLIYILEGMQKALLGEMIEVSDQVATHQSVVSRGSFNAHSELEYGYCTEFILQLQHKKVDVAHFEVKTIVEFLETLGDSIVALKDEDIVKVHVHTKTPGVVLSHCQQYGEYITLKIENMSVQHTETTVGEQANQEQCNCPECVEARKKDVHKKFAIVSVASGEGLIEVFKEMGVDYVVEGGQSMNPAAEDFVKGFDSLNADNIIVFPNNSNIVLTAEQAAKYYEKAKVYVVPSKTLAQGYSALTMLDLSSGDIDTILEEIKSVMANVTTGLVTYSIRNAEIEGVHINEGDYIGICNGKIVVSEKEKEDAFKGLLANVDMDEKEIITIIYGKDVDEAQLEMLQAYISETYPKVEVESISGKQDVYSYILSIE
ncbi:MAG: DAK2 domain-containing protein [Anaeroplasma bactoclasticum]|nr:DAK2 domain-containing protein [Anaeroplasma bactoclasticum]